MKQQKNIGERTRGRKGPDSRPARFAHRFLIFLRLFYPQRSLVLGYFWFDHSVFVIFYLGWNLCAEYLWQPERWFIVDFCGHFWGISRQLGIRWVPFHCQFATLETKKNLGRVSFRKDWDCYWWQVKTLANSSASPVMIPKTTAGHISAPVPFVFLKWPIVLPQR